MIAYCLRGLAGVAVDRGEHQQAARSFAAASRIHEDDTPLPPVYRARYNQDLDGLRTNLDPTAFDAAWTEGGALSTEQAITLALSRTNTQ